MKKGARWEGRQEIVQGLWALSGIGRGLGRIHKSESRGPAAGGERDASQ